MTKHLRTFKACIVMGVLILSIFAVLMPSSSAGIIFPIKSQATLQLVAQDPAALAPFVKPLEPMVIPIRVNYLISGLFANGASNHLGGRAHATISLSVVTADLPEWAAADVEPNVISIQMEKGVTFLSNDVVVLTVSFKEGIPARGRVTTKIKMVASPVKGILHQIEGTELIGTITVTPEFMPLIDATPRVTYAEVSPGQPATIPIDCENLGNAMTEFIFKIVNVPDGWVASIPANAFIASAAEGKDPKDTINLLITPPYGFGYHNELEDITVSIKGQYFGGPSGDKILDTSEYFHTISIRNRGFSTPGFEAIFLIFALVGVVFIFKKRQKNK
jgi:hypothetical protein